MTTVAIFSTYVPSEGFGGPARILQMRRSLEQAGYDVVHVVVEAYPSREPVRPRDIVELVERPRGAPLDHIYEDVDLGCRAAADKRVIDRVVRHLRSHRVSLVLLEQPFLIGLAEIVVNALQVPTVYSSQNIEYRLRRELERFQPDWRRSTQRAAEVRELEERSIALATQVTAICPTDQLTLMSEFGTDSTLVPNGSALANPSRAASPPPTQVRPDFVFAGSAYWPNVEGFAQIATPSLAFLPPTARVFVAGSVGRALLDHRDIRRHLAVNQARLELLGFLPVAELEATMRSAHCVLVPVFVGEGSNLKSADALACGAPTIMSRRATHGYEDVLATDSSGVTVVDTVGEFRAAMLESFNTPIGDPNVGVRRSGLLDWRTRLTPMLDVVKTSLQSSPHPTRGDPGAVAERDR